jgi:hypothetical protein
MARIIDKLHKAEFLVPAEIRSDYKPSEVREQLKKSFVTNEKFIVDNVHEYIFSLRENKPYWDYSEIPCLTPPFSNFWMEYSFVPEYKNSFFFHQVGMLFMCGDGNDYQTIRTSSNYAEIGLPADPFNLIKFVILGVFFAAGRIHEKDFICGPLGQVLITLDKDGKVIDAPNWILAGFTNSPIAKVSKEDRLRFMTTAAIAPFVAISLMHCKNVEVVNNKVDHKLKRAFFKT